jgi:hypothetical protein
MRIVLPYNGYQKWSRQNAKNHFPSTFLYPNGPLSNAANIANALHKQDDHNLKQFITQYIGNSSKSRLRADSSISAIKAIFSHVNFT